MDSNFPAKPAYGVYKSHERYARVCTSKLDFAKRLRRLSRRLNQQGFKSALLVRSFDKLFKRHGAIKYNTTLQEMRRQSMVEWLLI